MSLAKKTTTGIIWNFTETMSKKGFAVITTLLLARFLTPEDFGLISMMAVFIAVAGQIMESGFKQAIIRKLGATQEDFNTAFYSNLFLGALAYVLLFFSAPLIADFYEETRLIVLIRVLGIVIPINSFQVIQSAILSRELNFKAQLKATVPASIISAVIAIFMAFNGYGVWSLIIQMIVSAFLTTVSLWLMRLWTPTLTVSQGSLFEMFGFGSKLFISGLIDIVFQNMYIVVIAKMFTATIAGHFFFAKKIKELIANQLVNSVQTVTFPALASLQENNASLKSGYRKIIQVTTFLIFPSMLFMAALAQPIFMVFLNDQWLPAYPYLQLMCLSHIMYPLHSINLNILKVKGRSDLFLYLEIIKKIFAVAVLAMSFQYGVIGILIGQIIASFIAYIPNSYFSGKLINYPAREQIYDILPNLLISGTIAVTIYIGVEISTLPALFELALFGFLAGATYILASYIFKMQAVNILEHIIREKFRRKTHG
ncbi:lipopolysaccharide biosynthesis protein [Methanolobus chelungpuianus]|uniref:Capsule biosynthesis protein CapK n=1 Tax=Methanolobus chelungpuianus TaxID=502115 RepID=A0AAE3H9W3_9EURY|nr:lipopolysaccharide biosynthesis protein [Methanolobus chelungpuianus]MCQ6962319.1 capsule biosynthesis protein CapK [Methanolobus chelungpuianus]